MQPYPTYFNQSGASATPPQPHARPYTGAKRGRKPRGAGPNTTASSNRPEHPPQPGPHTYPIQTPPKPQQPNQQQHHPEPSHPSTMMPPPQYTPPIQKGKGKEEDVPSGVAAIGTSSAFPSSLQKIPSGPSVLPLRYPTNMQHQARPVIGLGPSSLTMQTSQLQMKPPGQVGSGGGGVGAGGGGDDEDDAEELPVMPDDVYGQGLLWQSQSKENLKVLMDNFTPEQFERYEAYRRSALPKQTVRKVIQQTTNYTISQPVAQVVAGFAKVFVGEMVEKARHVQEQMGEPPDTPLSPEHLREAYRLYQEETGKVGAARVHRGKKLFVR